MKPLIAFIFYSLCAITTFAQENHNQLNGTWYLLHRGPCSSCERMQHFWPFSQLKLLDVAQKNTSFKVDHHHLPRMVMTDEKNNSVLFFTPPPINIIKKMKRTSCSLYALQDQFSPLEKVPAKCFQGLEMSAVLLHAKKILQQDFYPASKNLLLLNTLFKDPALLVETFFFFHRRQRELYFDYKKVYQQLFPKKDFSQLLMSKIKNYPAPDAWPTLNLLLLDIYHWENQKCPPDLYQKIQRQTRELFATMPSSSLQDLRTIAFATENQDFFLDKTSPQQNKSYHHFKEYLQALFTKKQHSRALQLLQSSWEKSNRYSQKRNLQALDYLLYALQADPYGIKLFAQIAPPILQELLRQKDIFKGYNYSYLQALGYLIKKQQTRMAQKEFHRITGTNLQETCTNSFNPYLCHKWLGNFSRQLKPSETTPASP